MEIDIRSPTSNSKYINEINEKITEESEVL